VAELVARVENLITGRQRLRERLRREARPAAAAPSPGAAGRAVLRPAPPAFVPADDRFLEAVRQAVEEHLGEATFRVEALAEAVGMTRVHLYRRLRALCGETPSALLQRMRLERAAALLRGRAGNVAEVAYAVGFRSANRFGKAFRAHFGATPSAYARGADGETAGDGEDAEA
jgi:transcriptional regulator GlxA family with amidase domain